MGIRCEDPAGAVIWQAHLHALRRSSRRPRAPSDSPPWVDQHRTDLEHVNQDSVTTPRRYSVGMMATRILAAKQTRAAVALTAVALVAVGSPGVANAWPPGFGSPIQRDQDEPAHGYADAIGGEYGVPTNWTGNWLFGNAIPRGNYGVVASPSAGVDDTYGNVGTPAQSMPIVMPAGRPAPAPTPAAVGGQTAAAPGAQPTIPAPLAIPIIPAGAPS